MSWNSRSRIPRIAEFSSLTVKMRRSGANCRENCSIQVYQVSTCQHTALVDPETWHLKPSLTFLPLNRHAAVGRHRAHQRPARAESDRKLPVDLPADRHRKVDADVPIHRCG